MKRLIFSSILLCLTLTETVGATIVNDTLKQETTKLRTVTVKGTKRTVVYKLDRQQINASANITASGGTAVDVLAGTPSVEVNADGDVTFRGSAGFLVYVDGKPSPLDGAQALRQIPAASIESIEIITTPSARYKTEGDVGIISITTRRTTQEGLSGLVNFSTSTLGSVGGDLLLNYTHGRHRWYAGGQTSVMRSKSDFRQNKETLVDDYGVTSRSDGTRFRTEKAFVGRLGWQYADSRHDLTVEAQSGQTENRRGGDMDYDERRTLHGTPLTQGLYDSHDRYALIKDLAQLSTDYVWRTHPRGDRLTFTARLRYDWYSREYTESNMFTTARERYEGTRGYEIEHHWDGDGSLAYLWQYRPQGRLETGYQYVTYSESGDYKITYWNRAAQAFQWQDDLYAPFYYRRQVHSLYAMATDKFGALDVETGLRADRTIDQMDISVAGASRHLKRFELFPSAHASYATPHAGTWSAGYSRRTNRPGIWQLEPYITYEDYYTKKIGNPDIRPEYIHSLEAGWRRTWSRGLSFGTTAFCRMRSSVVDVVRKAYEPGVTLDSIINAGNQTDYGLEATATLRVAPWWNFTANGSFFRYDFRSRYEGCTNADGTSYTFGLINRFTLSPALRMQFDGHVVGPHVLTQGREDAYCYFDLALRHERPGKPLSIGIVAHDVLHTARYHNERHTATLQSETRVRPKYPNIVLSLSYRFRAAKAKETDSTVSKGALFEGKDF